MIGRPEIVNKIVAKKLNIPDQEVSNIMDCVYKEMAVEFQECNHPFIYVKDFGTFAVGRSALIKRLYRLHNSKKVFKSNKDLVRSGKALETIRNEMFFLFSVRRMLKNRLLTNIKLRNGKNI